ncbi:hypothetical protein Ddye_025473 [Dipteronia dyeriana]|uniref:Uncharacterized protein n=1 Tax=Dipteronia dyeriana TaxID=168575 RepID=A0AAD9TKU9_9ROSI|nr:hypothetical protein Ddye_025473 [Dipteronia dyeriana]
METSKKGKSPLVKSPSLKSSHKLQIEEISDHAADGKACKRKLVFKEDNRDPKKGRLSLPKSENMISNHSPEFIFPSETKVNGNKASRVKEVLGFNGCFSVDSVGISGGLMLLWKDILVVTVLSFSSGHIDARVRMEDGFLWRFTGFYGDPKASKMSASWSLLRRLKGINNLLWLCGGYFNKLLSMKDKVGGSDKGFVGMFLFRKVVDECNLSDLGYSGLRRTWNNKRDGN